MENSHKKGINISELAGTIARMAEEYQATSLRQLFAWQNTSGKPLLSRHAVWLVNKVMHFIEKQDKVQNLLPEGKIEREKALQRKKDTLDLGFSISSVAFCISAVSSLPGSAFYATIKFLSGNKNWPDTSSVLYSLLGIAAASLGSSILFSQLAKKPERDLKQIADKREAEEKSDYTEGWNRCFDQLASYKRVDPAATAPLIIYFPKTDLNFVQAVLAYLDIPSDEKTRPYQLSDTDFVTNKITTSDERVISILMKVFSESEQRKIAATACPVADVSAPDQQTNGNRAAPEKPLSPA